MNAKDLLFPFQRTATAGAATVLREAKRKLGLSLYPRDFQGSQVLRSIEWDFPKQFGASQPTQILERYNHFIHRCDFPPANSIYTNANPSVDTALMVFYTAIT